MTTFDAHWMVMKLIEAVVENECAGPDELEAAREDFLQQRDAVIGEIERLRADIGRLREALREIANMNDEMTEIVSKTLRGE